MSLFSVSWIHPDAQMRPPYIQVLHPRISFWAVSTYACIGYSMWLPEKQSDWLVKSRLSLHHRNSIVDLPRFWAFKLIIFGPRTSVPGHTRSSQEFHTCMPCATSFTDKSCEIFKIKRHCDSWVGARSWICESGCISWKLHETPSFNPGKHSEADINGGVFHCLPRLPERIRRLAVLFAAVCQRRIVSQHFTAVSSLQQVDHWAIHSFFAENFVVASCKTTRTTCISYIYIYMWYIYIYQIYIYIYLILPKP